MKRTLIIIVLIYSLLSAACSTSQINRAINLLSTVPVIVQQLHLPNEAQILNALDEITHGLQVFRDNPTRGNYRNALKAIDGALERNVFHLSATLVTVIQTVRAILASIVPLDADRVGGATDRMNVKAIQESQVDELEQKIKELKESVK